MATNQGDPLLGVAGGDVHARSEGSDTLISGEGHDYLAGGEGDDTYVFNWGSSYDALVDSGAGGQLNVLQFGEGISPSHIRLERNGLDLIVHYARPQSANAISVHNFYLDMKDRVGNGAISALVFETGERHTLADFGLDTLDPVIRGTSGEDYLTGGGGDDTIEGYAGNDSLSGNPGNDILIGDLGNDTLRGFLGNDTMLGGLGNDTYELLGAGQDTLIESGAEGEQNILQFAQGVNPDQIRLERVGNHLVVHYDQSKAANSVTLQDYYTSAQDSVGKGYISELVFDTGRYTLGHFGLEALSTAIAGTDGNDMLSGFNSNDTLEGHAGNDTLVGKAGNDILIGGLGDDTYELYSGSGHDTVIESGVAGEQNILKFGPGTHPAHLRLERVGNSLVVHYDQSKVANSVTLQDYYTGADDSTGKAYISALVFASGERYTLADFLPQAPVLTGTIADVVVDTNNVNEGQSFSWVVPVGLFTTTFGSTLSYSFALADGSPLPAWLTYDPHQGHLLGNPYDAQVGDLAIVVTATNSLGLSTQTSFQLQGRDINDAPTASNNPITLTGFANEPLGMGYGGYFQDRDEGDVLTYSATLADGSPLPVWLSFTQTDASSFYFSGTPAVESVGMLDILLTATDQHGASLQKLVQLEVVGVRTPISGTEGNDELVGTRHGDTLQGNAGNDTLVGGEGYDFLYGGEGSDTYVLNWGSSHDDIHDSGIAGDQNVLKFGQGITPENIRLERKGLDLIVHYEQSKSANAVTVRGFYADIHDRVGNGTISALVFDNGERYTLTDFGLEALDQVLKGTAGDDWMVGRGSGYVLEGYAGNDTLMGFDNSNTLIGGLGDDTYVIHRYSFHDTVVESGTGGEQNILQFAQGITPDQIRLERVGNHLVVHYDQSKAANSVTLQDYYTNAQDSVGTGYISQLVFASGERYTLADFLPQAPVLTGTIADVVVDTNNIDQGDSFIWAVPQGLFSTKPGSYLNYSFALADGSPLPSWLTYDPGQQYLRGNPYQAQVGDLTIVLTATDSSGLSTQTSFQLQGREINDTPTLFILPSVPAFFAGEFSSYGPGCAFDIDIGDMITYTATLADGSPLPSWLNFGQSDPKGTTGFQLSGVPTGDFVGMLDILVTATDKQGASVQQLMQVEVTGVRTPIVGTDGNDDLSGTRHGDTLQGHAGNDKLSGLSERDTLIGGAGDDTLIGGDSDDHLDGGEGNDTYLFNKGFSRDTLIDSGAAGQQNVLQFGEGISPAHIRLERKGLDLIVHFEQSKSADAITVQGFYADMHDLVGNGAISQLVFENGERYTLADFGLNALDPVIKGTAGDDQLSGENIADKIEGYAGNDSLYGNYGNDILIGDLGNDMLNGGADRDTLMGGLGNDTYELAGWSGHDTVIESGAEGEQNILQFAQGVNPDQIRLERVGNHLVVHYDQSKAANSVMLQDYYTSAQDSVGKGYISELVFDTGRYTLSHFGLEALSTAIAGTDGNDMLSGFNSNDTLEGHAGNDTLVGKAGNDILIGGLGDDTYELYSGSGHDTVIESGVAGEQNILKFGPGTHPAHLRLERVGNSLVVHYDQSKVANSVTLQDYYHGVEDKIGKGLIGAVQFDGTGETIAFSHFLSQLNQAPVVAGEVVDQLATAESPFSWQLPAGLFADADGDKLAYTVSQADGSALPVWLKFDATTGLLSGTPVNSQAGVLALRVTATDPGSLSTHLDFALQVQAINHAPEAVGTLEKQTMRVGQPFEFYLPEGIFRDVDSEAGDSLTLSFTLADGSPLPAWLSFDAATRKLSGTPGAASVGDLQLVVVAQDTAGATAKLGLGLTVAAPAGAVLTGGTGADNLQGTAGADSLSGMAGNDKLYGNDGNDTLRGDAGNDLLDGGEGDNLLDGGDGNDKLYGGSGHETLLGGAGNDQLYGWSGNDKLDGGLGNDTLTGDEGHDLLQGGAGRDELFGGVGNDTLASGAGADWLEGGQGDDTYRFLRGDGFDVITELAGEGSDTIHFGEGIAVNQLKVGRSGNDLEVRLAGSGDGITVRGWFAAEGNRVEQFLFDDGQVLTASQLEALLPATKQSARTQAQPVESFGPIALPAAGVDGREFQRPAPLHDMELVGRSDAGIAQQVSSLVDAMASFAPSSMGNLAAGMSTQDIYTPLLTKPQQ
ncbi:hypothetical protein GCM10007907_22140 [Chitinimonas prasina]|uniref:Dystroglycan-type cadherin-like domain-containing protein n=2 Tax=Chitinimonas prasina TaxID=1434937 RepID=A0ABQ5YKF8_9NEIS|nr:hypothetical protein GCM10007907_22140 [Chitinimonas prasina]